MHIPPVNISEIVYGLICILGVIGNLLIIYTIVTAFSSKSRSAIVTRCILQITICDLLTVLQIPFLIATLSQKNWPFGSTACQVSNVILLVQQIAKAFLLILLGLTSYANQIGSIFHLTEFRITFMISICWICGLVVGIPAFLLIPVGHKCHFFSEVEEQFEFFESFVVVYAICNFLFPLLVFLFLCCKIGKVSQRSYFERPMKLSLVLTGAHTFFMAPMIAFLVIRAFHKVAPGLEEPWRAHLALHSNYIWYSSSAVFPILYFIYWSTLKEQMRNSLYGHQYGSFQQLPVRG